MQLAQVVQKSAAEEEERLRQELKQLQLATVAESGDNSNQQQQNSISAVNSALAKVLADMKSSSFVDEDTVKEAEAVMESLSAGLAKVSQLACQAAAEQQMGDVIMTSPPQGVTRSAASAVGSPERQPERIRQRLHKKVADEDAQALGFTEAPALAPKEGVRHSDGERQRGQRC